MLPKLNNTIAASYHNAPFESSILNWTTSDSENMMRMGYWVLLFILLLALCVFLLSNKRSVRLFDRVSNNLLVVSLVVWFVGVVIYIVGYYHHDLNALSVIPRAIISSFKMFVVMHDLARVSTSLHTDALYMTLFSLTHFVAAFIAFLFIFRTIGYRIKSSLSVLLCCWLRSRGKVVHLFWGVNEASCLLAEDIRRTHGDEIIIFVDVDKESEDGGGKQTTLSGITNVITVRTSEVQRLDAIEALVDHCYNGPAGLTTESAHNLFGVLHLKNISRILKNSRRANIYLLSDDERNNIVGALNLQYDMTLRSMVNNSPVIYVHAHKSASNEVLDHYSQYDVESQRIKIKIVDSAILSVSTLKYDDRALPVNCVEVDKDRGIVDSPFTSMIIGFGPIGQEAFRFLYEYSAFVDSNMHRSPFRCYAIDQRMSIIEGLVREKMPAIGDDELTLIEDRVNSQEFWLRLRGLIGNLNYIVIALNDDELDLSLAVNIFKYALKMRPANCPMLKIMLRCFNSGSEQRMTEIIDNLNRSVEGRNVEIRHFGRARDVYRCDMILSDSVLNQAKLFNKVYEDSDLDADEQWELNFGDHEIERLVAKKRLSRYHAIYDVNRRIKQNISNAQHCRTKMILMGFSSREFSERLRLYYGYVQSRAEHTTNYPCGSEDARLLTNMAVVEHERWVASHKLLGYTYNPENNVVLKHHNCICPWGELDEVTKSYDCNVVDTTIKLAYKNIMKEG